MKNLSRWGGIFLLAILGLLAFQTPDVSAAAVQHVGLNLQHVLPMFMGITLGANVLTLTDWAKRLDPDGKVPDIVEMLTQTNEVLDDMTFIEANNILSHRTTVRTGLPAVAWRLLNQGVAVSKSTTAQIDETIGLLEAWAEVDIELAKLAGNESAFRLSEAQAFIEAMNQEMARTLFYGNSGIDPEKFTGLAVRYSDTTARNGTNIIKATTSPTGSDQTSIWLIVWGPQTLTGIFPKGSKAGLEHKDLGEQTAEITTGIGGSRMRVYQDQFIWKMGIALRDWRYVVRICNIDESLLVAGGAPAADLLAAMARATWRIPAMGMGKAVFYMNRSVGEYLDIQAKNAVSTGGQLGYNEIDGRRIMNFRGIPIKITDQILDTESIVV